MSLNSNDIAILRHSFNRSLTTKNFTLQEYHEAMDALERIHLHYFLEFSKYSKSNQEQSRRYFYHRHKIMSNKLDSSFTLANLQQEKKIEF